MTEEPRQSNFFLLLRGSKINFAAAPIFIFKIFELRNIKYFVHALLALYLLIDNTNDDENDVDVTVDQGWMICLSGNRALEGCHIATYTPTQ